MNRLLDKLNLRPQERRLVVIVGLVVFVVLNIWVVRPQFGQVGFWQNKQKDSEKQLKKFNDELKRKRQYEVALTNLESQGYFVATDEQALRLMEEVRSEAALANMTVIRWDPTPRGISTRTNSFFEEQTLNISVLTGEKELVDFLYNLGARNSLIRVKSMSLQPDPTKMKLQGSVTLVESFQKKARPTALATTVAGKPATPTTAAVKPTNAPPRSATQPALATNTVAKTNAPRKLAPTPIPPRKT